MGDVLDLGHVIRGRTGGRDMIIIIDTLNNVASGLLRASRLTLGNSRS